MIVTFRNNYGLVFTGIYDCGTKPTRYDPGESETFTILRIEGENGENVTMEFSDGQLRAMDVRYLQEARNACRVELDESNIEKFLAKEEALRYAWDCDV